MRVLTRNTIHFVQHLDGDFRWLLFKKRGSTLCYLVRALGNETEDFRKL